MDWKKYKQDRRDRYVQAIRHTEHNLSNFEIIHSKEENELNKKRLEREIEILKATRQDLITIVKRMEANM